MSDITNWSLRFRGATSVSTSDATTRGAKLKVVVAAVIVLVVAFAHTSSHSASINHYENRDDISEVRLAGQIQDGDAERLLTILKSQRFGVHRLSLDSSGGSIVEALRLAQIIEKASMYTVVRAGRICASACFFVYLAGAGRYAASRELMEDPAKRHEVEESTGIKTLGFLGIHRPFSKGLDSPQNLQGTLMHRVTGYLERQLISRRLIDIMMTRPSNDIYWLTLQDLEEISEYPPPLEEYLIQRCAYDRNGSQKALNADDDLEFSKRKAELQRSQDCEIEELAKHRTKGLADIRKGWRPPVFR